VALVVVLAAVLVAMPLVLAGLRALGLAPVALPVGVAARKFAFERLAAK
jgi:hypothetical protein